MKASLSPSIQPTRALVGGAVALFLAGSWTGLAAWRAFMLDPVDRVVAAPEVQWPAVRESIDRDSVLAFLDAAAGVDPFDPARGEGDAAVEQPADVTVELAETNPRATLRLIGTVVDPAGQSFVIGQLGNEQPKVVRIGGTIGAYRLTSVRQGSAQFAHNGEGVVTLLVATTDRP